MTLKQLEKYQKILILGYGVEGQATLDFLKKKYSEKEYVIADEKMGKDYLEKQRDCDLAIKSPGINKDKVTIEYTTATNIFFANVLGTTIGVTATKGKSTTASLIYAILKMAGKKVHLVGNIGNPMLQELAAAENTKDEIWVCELSSYQLDDINYSPNVSVILNLYADHMDYHGSLQLYREAKKNIVKFATEKNHFIYNAELEQLQELAKQTKAISQPVIKELPFSFRKIQLKGKHNETNIRAAYTVAKIFNVEDDLVKAAVEEFQPLKHRLEFVGEYRGVLFYDDAISTTPESTIAAIEALPEVGTIFLGGLDRGYDFDQLASVIAVSKIENLVVFPESGKKILAAILRSSKREYKILETDQMDQAVKFAFDVTKKGRVCLLSTASPSYSLWKNFEEKGQKFREAIEKLK